jgi:hypothetical protein
VNRELSASHDSRLTIHDKPYSMQLLIAYLLKLAFCLALGYLFYFLLLRRMTWYNWNRYFLLFFPLTGIADTIAAGKPATEYTNIERCIFCYRCIALG